jgi:phospholipase/lecithinase/hemolysin
MKNYTLCANRDTYMFWDSIHSTQRAAEIFAQGMFEGSTQLTMPISFKQLAFKRY